MKQKSILISLLFSFYTLTATSEQAIPNDVHQHAIAREYCLLAQHMEQANLTAKAQFFYQKAIELVPEHADANIQLGSIYFNQHSIEQAILCYQNALKSRPNDPHILFNLGLFHTQQKEWQEAITYSKKTIELDPSHEKAYINLGTAYEKSDNKQGAIEAYRKAVLLNPESFDNQHRLGNLLRQYEQLEDAIEPYRKAIALQPRNVHIMMDLANALHMLDRNEEALELYKDVVEINPNILSALYNFGFTLKKLGHLEHAMQVYHQLIAQKPDYAHAHFSLSSIYLTLGNFEQGLDEYEWRWKTYNESDKKFNCPVWQGEDLANQTLLIYAEQGLGDTIHFVRYAKLLKEQYAGLKIIFESQLPLVALMQKQPYLDQVIARGGRSAPFAHYQIPLMSIPRIVKTRLETIPADIPYIQGDASLKQKWNKKLSSDHNFKVGICWQGNARYSTQSLRRAVAAKSIALSLFAPLLALEGVTVYSLQRIDGDEQIQDCEFADKLVVFDESFDQTDGRFMDTTAVIEQLDLIISVDTSIAHLAGALGKPTWIVLPYPTDWRWFLHRTDSPWYPTARLFQQKTTGQWEPVMQQIVTELQTMLAQNKIAQPQTIARIYNEPDETQIQFFEQIIQTLTH